MSGACDSTARFQVVRHNTNMSERVRYGLKVNVGHRAHASVNSCGLLRTKPVFFSPSPNRLFYRCTRFVVVVFIISPSPVCFWDREEVNDRGNVLVVALTCATACVCVYCVCTVCVCVYCVCVCVCTVCVCVCVCLCVRMHLGFEQVRVQHLIFSFSFLS